MLNLILIGFQASGKTTLGQLAADSMQKAFYDSDRLIENSHAGLNCSRIVREFGEPYFRQLERGVVKELEIVKDAVISLGGGTILCPLNQRSLKRHGLHVYLKTSETRLKERIWSRASLPAYLDQADPEVSFLNIYRFRSRLYERLADHTLDMDEIELSEAVLQLKRIFSS